MYIYLLIYLFDFCKAYISSHPKGPEQDQLRSPFVPYVRNTAERSVHNFDSQPDTFDLLTRVSLRDPGLRPARWLSHFVNTLN